ncbi:MAG: methyltransferase domain-containing protein [Deltaproteobacteria bacterium]|nr:methyltransferase domain-containing protein [Deltaproteobacteria bacterium]
MEVETPPRTRVPEQPTRLSPELFALLRCPACSAALAGAGKAVVCQGRSCGRIFPVVEGIPILVADEKSVFTVEELARQPTGGRQRLVELARQLDLRLPQLGQNLTAGRNYGRLAELLAQGDPAAPRRVLVVAGRIPGEGMQPFLDNPRLELVETDLAIGPRTRVVCDAHDLPFPDQSFDAVTLQAFLCEVLDPFRCVAEAHRVLKPGGLVYAETPFMQQVHSRSCSLRFTPVGHRRLFRSFDELDSGAVCGPGMALAWTYQYFLLSFFRNKAARALVRAHSRAATFWLKYFDRLLIDRPTALDAASGVYFLGRRRESPISDEEVLASYRGGLT